MGATYLSMHLRTADRAATIGALEAIAAAPADMPQQFFVADPADGWLALFPNFTPDLERTAKALSSKLGCLIVWSSCSRTILA